MFRRYPYRGWLLLSVLLWGIAISRFYVKNGEITPKHMTHTVEEDIRSKEADLTNLLDDKDLIERLFSEKPTEADIRQITSLPYYIYGYDHDTLVFWNTNELLADCNHLRLETRLEKNDRGSFIKRCITPRYLDSNKKITALLPIVYRYPFENSYLHSHFEAQPYIPINTEVLDRDVQGSYEITSADGKPLFYLLFSQRHIVWMPGKLILWIIAAALLSSIVWLQLITIYTTRKRSPWFGFAVTVIAIVGVRAITYLIGLPFNLRELPVFSPQLYASSSFLPSLGDLLINALCFLWIAVFTIRHVPYNVFRNAKLTFSARLVIVVVITSAMLWYGAGYIDVVRSLVQDSMISFDVSHFYSITFYTIVGLFTISIITGVSCLVFYLLNVQLSALIGNKWLKYAIIIFTGIVLLAVSDKGHIGQLSYYLFACLILLIILLDIKPLTNISDLFSPQMIFWSVLVCVFCSGLLLNFYNIKEKETRKRYAEQVLQQRDDVTEFAFKNISANIQKDGIIKGFLQSPSPEKRRAINERFDALYLGGQLNKYQAKILIFDKNKRSLYNNDTVSYNTLDKEVRNASPTEDSTLYHKEYAQHGDYYLADIPVYSDSAQNKLGYVFVDLSIKESGGESVYPELLQPGSVKNTLSDINYSYGVYLNDKLLTQNGDFSFPVYLNYGKMEGEHTFTSWQGSSELRYRADASKTIIVIRFSKLWQDFITLFSYLFGIQLIVVIFIVVYRLYLSYFTRPKSSARFINLTLKKRIHFSMLGIVLISFLVIGVVTIVYFTIQYKQTNQKKMSRTMQAIERSTLQYLKQENALGNNKSFNNVTVSTRFKYFITALANAQKVDINIFNASGILSVASQESIFDKILLARIIRPDAYYRLRDNPSVVQNESIGRLSYSSCYLPLRDNDGKILGYINVPFFSSEKELNFQISNILVALINLYAFIFLISTVLTVFITRWLTKTLSVVISRFERLSLTKNEPIDWPYEDEIGTLVSEYNKMVKKVEENAVLLAQSERESAWREMARQVAHEIKNPLTPMKLNIQYLQQAIKSGHANVEGLALKVSESLIEQIDNLSYIASEFSNFAKMPEARPEDVDVNELLDRPVELYLNEEHTRVSLKRSAEPLIVYADKSQLLRVFTNLLENAVQAVPEDREGVVVVSLQKEDNDALISFSDNGAGISPEVVERIFQPYFTTKSSGTGLGLAMTKKIIEFWKGSIWFETEEGKGTTFYIKLPLV